MSVPPLAAHAIALNDALHYVGRPLLHPGEQGRPKIEAHPGIVVDQIDDFPALIDQPCPAVGPVALAGDALVPVVERAGGILNLNGFEPGILARRLVEVTVNADIT